MPTSIKEVGIYFEIDVDQLNTTCYIIDKSYKLQPKGFNLGGAKVVQNCIRCKGKYKLLVPLRPIEIKSVGDGHTNYKYACTCGCSFERTV